MHRRHDKRRRASDPGVDKVISEELPKLKKCFNKKVMANVSGFSVDEYAYTCERLDSQEQVGWLESMSAARTFTAAE